MDRDDEFEGDLSFDTSASRAKAVRLSVQRLNLHDDMVAEGVEPDIAAIFLKIGGHPPVVLLLFKSVYYHTNFMIYSSEQVNED